MAASPYVEARHEWDERYADLILGKRNWQIAAGGLLLLSLILASAIVWLVSRSRYIPYVVEVDKLGYAITVPQALSPSSVPDMRIFRIAASVKRAHAYYDVVFVRARIIRIQALSEGQRFTGSRHRNEWKSVQPK